MTLFVDEARQLAPFNSVTNLPNQSWLDYRHGPIAIQDVSQGFDYQIWRGRLIDDDVYIGAVNTPEFIIFNKRCINWISFTFDQSGRYILAYIVGDSLWLYWYDSFIEDYRDSYLCDGVTSVCITMDDPRFYQTGNSNIILGYTRNGDLCARKQEDRYTIETVLITGVGGVLIKMGLNNISRFQYLFQANIKGVYENAFPRGDI